MNRAVTITSVLVLSLIILSTGIYVRGLACSHVVQIEEIHETVISNVREQVALSRAYKQGQSTLNTNFNTHSIFSSALITKAASPIFGFKNPNFIRYCSFLI